MADLQRELEQQQKNEQLYRDNETTLQNKIRELNSQKDKINLKEREVLQKLEREGIQKQESLERKHAELQSKLEKSQTAIQQFREKLMSTIEKEQRLYTNDRDALSSKIKREELELTSTRTRYNRASDAVRKAQDSINAERTRAGSDTQGRQNTLR